MVASALLVSLLPGESLPSTGMSDKLEHAIAYAILALWFAGIYPRSRYGLIALGLFIMGVGVEFAPGAMHLGRHADARDVVANTSGIAIGLTLALTVVGSWAQRLETLLNRS